MYVFILLCSSSIVDLFVLHFFPQIIYSNKNVATLPSLFVCLSKIAKIVFLYFASIYSDSQKYLLLVIVIIRGMKERKTLCNNSKHIKTVIS